MKSMWAIISGACLFVALAAAPSARAEASLEVRVVLNTAPNPPIVYGHGTAIDPEKPSLIVELLRMVGERTGVVFNFRRVPWQRGLYMIEHGEADAIFASSYVEERTRFGAYPMKDGRPDAARRIHRMGYSLFVRRGSGVAWTGQAISGLRAPVGATPEFAIVPALKEMGVALDLEASTLGNLRKLAGGRIDAYAEIDSLAEAAIRAHPGEFGDIVKLSPPLRETPYYLMFSKVFCAAHPGVAELVWDAIPAVTASPAYRELVAGKYAD